MTAFLNRGNKKFNTNLFQACDSNTTTTTLYVNAVPTNIPCVLIIDPGLSTEECVQVTAKTSNTVTVVRNYDGNGIFAHAVNAVVVDYVRPEVILDIITIIEQNFNSNGTPKTMLTSDFSKGFGNFVVSGLNPTVPSNSLSVTIPAGSVFYSGVEYTVASDGGHAYTASEDTYVDVNPSTGVFTYNGVANNAAAPALTGNSIRIAKIITNGTQITTITQVGLDSLGNYIYPSSPLVSFNLGNDAQGDVYTRNAQGLFVRIPAGAAGLFLESNGAGQNPSWGTPSNVSNTTAKARAYMTGNNAVLTATFTKVPLNTITYDPGSNFDHTTNYRFTAPVAGKYQVNANIYFGSMTDGTECIVSIYKNGSVYTEIVYFAKTTGNQSSPGISDIVDLAANDYVELYAYQQSGSTVNLLNSSGIYNSMSVHLLSTG